MSKEGKNPYGTIAKGAEDVKIDRDKFPPNKKPGEEIPKVQAEIIIPKAHRQAKKGLKSAIVAADIQDFKSFVVYDCLVPFAKEAFMDILSRVLFNRPYMGSPRSFGPSTREKSSNYWSVSSRPLTSGVRDVSKDFIFDTREEAQDTLEHANEWCARVGTMTVADFCRIAGLTPEPGDIDYGWYNFSGARVTAWGDSWYIDMPRARRM